MTPPAFVPDLTTAPMIIQSPFEAAPDATVHVEVITEP
jgi:hypothetical protein